MKTKRFGVIVLTMILLISMVFRGEGDLSLAAAKKLDNVITAVRIWDPNNGSEATKTADGYQLVQDVGYRFETSFDLKAYNGNLENGDYFTFTIPAPMTLIDGRTFTFTDSVTNTEIGKAVVKANGTGAGGVVTVTLQKLDEYLQKTGGSEVRDIKGQFFVDMSIKTTSEKKTITFDSTETQGVVENTITVKPKAETPTTNTIGKDSGENYAKIGGVLLKRAYNSATLGISGEYVHPWRLRINTQQKMYDKLIVNDYISQTGGPMQFIPENFILMAGEYTTSLSSLANGAVKLQPGVDYKVTFNSAYTEFALEILRPTDKAFMLYYDTTSPIDGSTVGNTVTVTGNEQALTQSNKTQAILYTVTALAKITEGGSISLDTAYRIVVYKVDMKTNKKLPGAIFTITTPKGEVITLDPTDANGRAYSRTFSSEEANFGTGVFKIQEIKAPDGYLKTNEVVETKVGKDGTIRTIKNMPKTDITVTKKWNAGVTPGIMVRLLKNGTPTGQTLQLNSQNQCTDTFKDLPLYDSQGNEFTYTVDERGLSGEELTGYKVDYNWSEDKKNVIITNTAHDQGEISVTKVWKGKEEASVTIHLTANGNVVASKTLTKDTGWEYTFTNIELYDENGKEYTFDIEEEYPDGAGTYDKKVHIGEGNVIHVVNTNNEKVNFTVNKKWIGSAGEKAVVKLFVDDVEKEEVTLTEATEWKHEFKDLPKYDPETKHEFVYSIKEVAVDGYRTELSGTVKDGFVVTNTNTATINIPVTKKWIGEAGKQAIVKLLADGVEKKEATLTEATGWKHEFTNLPKFDATDGHEIVYSVKEVAVDGYKTTVDGNVTDGFVVTNSNVATISIPVTKKWVGEAGKQAVVKLFADGVEKEEITLTADMDWKYEFKDLPKFDLADGHEIIYTVQELPLEGFSLVVAGSVTEGFVFTNTNTATISIPVTKKWIGEAGKQAIVKLLADGVEKEEATLTEATGWKHEFTNLPKFDATDGHEIVYSVKEVAVDGYKTSITGNVKDGFVVTNTRNPVTPPNTPPNPPKKPPVKRVPPTTGDSTQMVLYASIMGVSLLGLLTIIFVIRRKRNK